ncbi:hypothetical protein AM493_07700 [Flavobacterium akiainvivens]|uniref:DUF2147 domain-containing protein n=1 Tax=Flavobacterium akiainvivens TaxID=1202724 RepID=A0A0N0RQL6_9FLAO|nr:DUF2147 domain-containing protein [Flavobacterium akiainvivens]KOS05930.1 hypothetical protein AM493_07700 [Flavobacterium akiainvivens]SFQ53365.1 Uncharacterized conserved protein, DUF2147 family [Flavobacterium akiainvivens]
MKRTFFTLLFVMFAIIGASAQVVGKWKTIDDETGQAKSIVEIYEKDGKVYGKIVEILNPAKKDAKCDKCKGADKGKPLLGLVIIKGLTKDDDEWTDGDILDPTKGKTYSCTITLDGKDKLKVRGYMGVSLLGRTQVWHRVK